jgi:Mlc titration factor MtfA (ptsG expression regulator)/Tfp pilus assembly protein PilF
MTPDADGRAASWLAMFSFFRKARRDKLLAGPFPEPWLATLRDNVLLYRTLGEAEQARVRDLVRVFVAEKTWLGCAGLDVTDEVRVTIAGQACVMLLGLGDYCFDEVKTVVVYPGGYLSLREDSLGGPDEVRMMLGEAHYEGPVVLSWWEARWDGRRLGEKNVVIHEFAHKLAQLDDPWARRPPVPDVELARRWKEVMDREYEKLVDDAAYDRPTLLDPYGAENKAEFFAVVSECFFLRPVAMRGRHRELYELLARWYGQDPSGPMAASAAWAGAESDAAEEEYTRHAVAECSAAIRHRPAYVEAYRDRAVHYCDLGDYDKALADCTVVIRLADEGERADAYHGRGAVHLEAGSYDEAVADFTEAIRRSRDFAEAYRDRGVARAALGDRAAALKDLSRALRLDPKDDAAWQERARAYADQGDYARALRDLTRAIALAPYCADHRSDRAAVYVLTGDYDRALNDCDDAIRLHPEMPEPYKDRGLAYYHKGNLDRALADLGEALRLDPDYAEAYRARAEVFEAKGAQDSARRDLEEAERLEQED